MSACDYSLQLTRFVLLFVLPDCPFRCGLFKSVKLFGVSFGIFLCIYYLCKQSESLFSPRRDYFFLRGRKVFSPRKGGFAFAKGKKKCGYGQGERTKQQ